jgi:hypothetical protein
MRLEVDVRSKGHFVICINVCEKSSVPKSLRHRAQ